MSKVETRKNGRKQKKAKNGKRYNRVQRRRVLDFVEKVNAAEGRGGVAAAARKFGVSASTIGSWQAAEAKGVSGNGEPSPVPRRTKRAETSRTLGKLIDLAGAIEALERELGMKHARYLKLKERL